MNSYGARVDDLASGDGPRERSVGFGSINPGGPLRVSHTVPIDVGGNPIHRQSLGDSDPLDQDDRQTPLQVGRKDRISCGVDPKHLATLRGGEEEVDGERIRLAVHKDQDIVTLGVQGDLHYGVLHRNQQEGAGYCRKPWWAIIGNWVHTHATMCTLW